MVRTGHFDQYKHLDDDDKFAVKLALPEVAKIVVKMNYGVHRLLCAIVTEMEKEGYTGHDSMVEDLRKVVEKHTL